MPHPVVHAEIRSADPDATREFFGQLWMEIRRWRLSGLHVRRHGSGWLPTAIGPLQGGDDSALFFVGVEDVAATLRQAENLGGRIVQPAPEVPGVTFWVLADAQGHLVGVAAS